MIDATKTQVKVWIERQRNDLTASLASCDRALSLPNFKEASPQRTRLEKSRALVFVDLGVIETLWACYQRWQLAKEGMLATMSAIDGYTPHVSVHYISGTMDEVAMELYGELPKDAGGVDVPDVTPIFDKMRETYEGK